MHNTELIPCEIIIPVIYALKPYFGMKNTIKKRQRVSVNMLFRRM